MNPRRPTLRCIALAALVASIGSVGAEESPSTSSAPPSGQPAAAPATPATPPAPATPSTPATPATPPPLGLASMAWLSGCWQGSVNNREFREVWLPQRGAMMLGVSQTVSGTNTLDYEYLRIENRGDAAYYVVSPPGKPESAFRLTEETVDASDGAHTFVFLDPAGTFPKRIGYRRGSEGWLYTEVEGTVNGAARRVIYPMRRVNCESGEIISK